MDSCEGHHQLLKLRLVDKAFYHELLGLTHQVINNCWKWIIRLKFSIRLYMVEIAFKNEEIMRINSDSIFILWSFIIQGLFVFSFCILKGIELHVSAKTIILWFPKKMKIHKDTNHIEHKRQIFSISLIFFLKLNSEEKALQDKFRNLSSVFTLTYCIHDIWSQ